MKALFKLPVAMALGLFGGYLQAENIVPVKLQNAVGKLYPGYDVQRFYMGDLLHRKHRETAVLLVRETEQPWSATYRIAVLTLDRLGGYSLVDESKCIAYPDATGLDITIKHKSLFVREASPGARLAEVTNSQYKYDGKTFILIGSELNTYYHGDGLLESSDEEYRKSTNYLTNRVLIYRGGRVFMQKQTHKIIKLKDLGNQCN